MVSDVVRRQVWNQLQESVRHSRYFARLISDMNRYHRARLLLLAVVSVSGDVRDCWVLIEDGRIDNESAHRRWNDAEWAINDAVEDWKASGMSINNRLNERSEEESVRLVKEEFSYAA